MSDEYLDARRRQIVDAAIACFAREGFHRATMQDICRAAGLSAGAVYRYFASKDEIIEAIAEERHSRESTFIEGAREAANRSQALRELGMAFFLSLDDPEERLRRRLGVQVWAESLRNPTILELVRRGVDRPRLAIAELVREGQESGEVSDALDPDSTARVMIALFQGLVLQQAWYDEVDVEAYLATVETLFDALLPQAVP